MPYRAGQRVTITRDMRFPQDDLNVPEGSLGTIAGHNQWPDTRGTYGVILDDDPKHLTTLCWPEDITPA